MLCPFIGGRADNQWHRISLKVFGFCQIHGFRTFAVAIRLGDREQGTTTTTRFLGPEEVVSGDPGCLSPGKMEVGSPDS